MVQFGVALVGFCKTVINYGVARLQWFRVVPYWWTVLNRAWKCGSV